MPKLRKLRGLRNMNVPWAPQVHSKERKIAEVEKENVNIYSSQNKIITKHTQTDPDASFTRSQESTHPKHPKPRTTGDICTHIRAFR
jgi:hypothetical protein